MVGPRPHETNLADSRTRARHSGSNTRVRRAGMLVAQAPGMASASGWVRRSSTEPTRSDDVDAWTVVLAGGEGVRLARYIRRRFGRRMPKQYCRLIGDRSLLEHTLDRTTALVPPTRTLAVIGSGHESLAMPQLAGRCDHVLRQPAARGTGVALYVAIAMIRRWTPNAIVMVTPSDHYVWPIGPYLEQTHAATCAAAELGGLVVLGVRPTDGDPDMGYLLLGERTSHVPRLSRVVGFVEKPTRALAAKLCERGALWNTMVVTGSVEAFWRLGRATQPRLIAMLDALVPRIGDRHEDTMLAHIYERHADVCFSRDMIQLAPHALLALELLGVDWSDWGRPDRVEAVLARRAAAAAPAVVEGRLARRVDRDRSLSQEPVASAVTTASARSTSTTHADGPAGRWSAGSPTRTTGIEMPSSCRPVAIVTPRHPRECASVTIRSGRSEPGSPSISPARSRTSSKVIDRVITIQPARSRRVVRRARNAASASATNATGHQRDRVHA